MSLGSYCDTSDTVKLVIDSLNTNLNLYSINLLYKMLLHLNFIQFIFCGFFGLSDGLDFYTTPIILWSYNVMGMSLTQASVDS